MVINKPVGVREWIAFPFEFDAIPVAMMQWAAQLPMFAYNAYVLGQGDFTFWGNPYPMAPT